ncbi:MAG: hypothetical protein QFE16_01935 [Pseudomonadota bacterium]|nr:hypothetical protein [Pseudomonadota bacterium]
MDAQTDHSSCRVRHANGERIMKFDERIDGDYRIYAGALDVLQGDGYIAAVVVSRVGGTQAKAREVFRDESLACGHRWKSADESLMFALCKAREWIGIDRQRTENLSENLSGRSAMQL